jgi:hypothetical protein
MELTAAKFGKLDVGDIAKQERWSRDRRKKELIDTMKELYGDNLPDDALSQIDNQLNCNCEESLEDVQYLLWLSMLKMDKDATYEQVGTWIDASKVEEYSQFLIAPSLAEKKRPRKPVKKKKKAKKKTKNR